MNKLSWHQVLNNQVRTYFPYFPVFPDISQYFPVFPTVLGNTLIFREIANTAFVSSANLSTLLDMSSSKSFIYIKNSIGPNTDPCGIPLKTDFQFEISPSTITLCLLCVSHFSIQLITSLPIPWATLGF